jgi:hypothetical protein
MEQIFGRPSSNHSSWKREEECGQLFCLWFTPTALSRKRILFLLGHALLQSSRTKFSVAWLGIFRPGTRHCHIWRASTIHLKTSQPCDLIQKDLQDYTPQVNINGSTTLQLYHQLPSSFCWSESQGKWRHPQLGPTMTPGWIGLTPNITH